MNKHNIIISADSTCDLSPEIIEKYGIVIDSMPVLLGDHSGYDGVDIFQEEVFEYTKKTGQLAKTSALNTTLFEDRFSERTKDGATNIPFDISSSLSGTYNNARLAALEIENVHVIDSINLSTGIGLQVIKAAEMARDGATAEEIVTYIEAMKHRVDASFVIDTLTHLHKGGRCSAVAMFGANALKLKPCIQVKNGSMGVVRKYRGKQSNVVLEYAKDQLSDLESIEPDRIFVTHTCPDTAMVDAVRDYVESLGYFKEILVTKAGSTVATHCGPDTLGVLFVRKNNI